MSQTHAGHAVLQAIHGDGAPTPYGSVRAQMQGTNAHIAVPIELTQHFSISRGYEIERAYHADTGCLISCLRDEVNLFER